MWFLFLLIALVSIFVCFKKLKRRYDISLRLPGPHSWPVIGYTAFMTSDPVELFKIVMDLQKQYDGLYKAWVFTDLWVVTNDPVVIERALTDQQFTKSNDYEMLKPWLGTGLLTSEGKKWFGRRKAITPAFHFRILEDFVKVFDANTQVLIEKLRINKSLDVMSFLPLYTLDNICDFGNPHKIFQMSFISLIFIFIIFVFNLSSPATSMGIEINAQNNGEADYVQAINDVASISYKRMFNPFLWYDVIFNLTKLSKTFKRSLQIIKMKTQNVIRKRREFLEKSRLGKKSDGISVDEYGRKKKTSLMDILLESTVDGAYLSDDEIMDEVNTFMFAGHDTTSIACGFLLYNIAKNSHVQQKLIEEILSVIGKEKTSEITTTDINELKYMDLVVKESLRYHTTVPLLGRQILKETRINEYLFPGNTCVTINVYGMCHSEKLFSCPEEFRPERFQFDDKGAERTNPFAFIPFSAGPRNCIGQKFALLEIKVMALRILQNFEISLVRPDEKLALGLGMTLRVLNGIHLHFHDRLY